VICGQTLALEPPNHGTTHSAHMIGIFAVVLVTATPARISKNIQIRSKENGLTLSSHFGCHGMSHCLMQIRIPAAADGTESRKNRGSNPKLTVVTIISDQHRDSQARVFLNMALDSIDYLSALMPAQTHFRCNSYPGVGSQQPSQVADSDLGENSFQLFYHFNLSVPFSIAIAHGPACTKLSHLFFYGHSFQKILHAIVYRL